MLSFPEIFSFSPDTSVWSMFARHKSDDSWFVLFGIERGQDGQIILVYVPLDVLQDVIQQQATGFIGLPCERIALEDRILGES